MSLAEVQRRYAVVNGEHEMSPADDLYVHEHFRPATDDELDRMLSGDLPLPSYLLSDGTPMVPDDVGRLAEIAADAGLSLHDWFVAFWPDDPATGEAEWEFYLSGQYVCLREVSPVTIRRKAVLTEQAEAAVAALRADSTDHVARGALGEALDGAIGTQGFQQILLPMAPYVRLRFGGPTSPDVWLTDARKEFLTPTPPELPLRTERLVLRAMRPEDGPAFVAAMADEDFVRWDLHPTMNRAEVLEWARWRATRDSDVLSLVVEHDGEIVGEVSLHPGGTGLSVGDLGWSVLPQHQGHGYATEAVRELIRVGFEHYAMHRLTANLDAENLPSKALAERVGMRQEQRAIADFWSKGRWTSSFTYALLAEEWRESQSH